MRDRARKHDASGAGLEAQRETVRGYLDGGAGRVVEEFVELESGRKNQRPALQMALAAARDRRCPIVVANVSWLKRSRPFLSRLLDAGVDIHFADSPSIEGPIGRLALQEMVADAEIEGGMVSRRTRLALKAAKARGKPLGGYRGKEPSAAARLAALTARKATASARAADLAPTISDLRGAGVTSLAGIARALTARGIPAPQGGGTWAATQVGRLLARLAS